MVENLHNSCKTFSSAVKEQTGAPFVWKVLRESERRAAFTGIKAVHFYYPKQILIITITPTFDHDSKI